MHLYCKCRRRLKKEFEGFQDGQFLLERPDGLIIRGVTAGLLIPDTELCRVVVEFERLYEPRFGVDKYNNRRPIWVESNSPLGSKDLPLEYTYYYPQRERADRKRRIKMWSVHYDEVWHFFQRDDPSNLKQEGDEFLPFYQPSEPEPCPKD